MAVLVRTGRVLTFYRIREMGMGLEEKQIITDGGSGNNIVK